MSSAGHPDVCGCVGSMIPMNCPDCAGHPRPCNTCGSRGVVFYPCQRCINGGGPINDAGNGAGPSGGRVGA